MRKATITTALLLCSVVTTPAQKIESALTQLTTKFPEEKAYIHYDKEYYVAGETIWFKGYLYSNGMPSSLSNNFYLQLIDEKGQVLSCQEKMGPPGENSCIKLRMRSLPVKPGRMQRIGCKNYL